MNWLAHVYLSEQNVEFKLGNLLADIVKPRERIGLSPEFLRGAQRHREIDAYTDAHPAVLRSRARISREFRRFSGVLVDVFYDHLLASRWRRYSSVELDSFTSEFYADATACPLPLPPHAQTALERICRYDLLGSYVLIEGVEQSLRRLSMRLSARWQKDFVLEQSTRDLRADLSGFEDDFAEFFPALRAHIDAKLSRPSSVA